MKMSMRAAGTAPKPRSVASASPMATGGLTPTFEQRRAMDAFTGGGTLVIEAGAGTGKTSTLKLLAGTRPTAKGLYVAYNKPVQEEAERTFPVNVTCKTAHALAYARFGQPMRHRLNGPRIPAWQVADILGHRGPIRLDPDTMVTSPVVAGMALRVVEQFCRSKDTEIGSQHFLPPPGMAGKPGFAELSARVTELAALAWTDLTSTTGRLHYQHDIYLKTWAMSEPRLNFDFVLLDEAQDADPSIASVVAGQVAHSQVVYVGDDSQSIYQWRGAISVMSSVADAHRTQLSQSFRFGQAIADEANLWLDELRATLHLTGNPDRTSIVSPLTRPAAVLCRSNAMAVKEVIAAHSNGVSVALVGDGRDIRSLALAALKMIDGLPASHPELVAFADWDAVRDYVTHDPGGSDLAVAVKLIDTYTARGVIKAIDACVPEKANPQLVVSTAHKAKGREWSTVRIAEDFPEPQPDPRTGEGGELPPAEAMLAYVAVTRAKMALDNTGLAWIHGREIIGRAV